MKKIAILLAGLLFSAGAQAQDNEVIYSVFQRSFFDSNGDGHGDLKGITEKLDYLQQLGVTAVMLTPLYQSGFYHNSYATDFEKVDPKYGGFKDYRDLVVEMHRRKMKIYQQVDLQYISEKHPWFVNSYKKPSSEFSRYIYYTDKKNEIPSYLNNNGEYKTYDNINEKIVTVNLKEPKVKEYFLKTLTFWADPNKDGSFNDGIDGFRLRGISDNLSGQKDMIKEFWIPLVADLKKVNPGLQVFAEQASQKSFGYEYLNKMNADRAVAFRLKQAIASFDKEKISAAADSTFTYLPKGKQQLVFIEGPDTKRMASAVGADVSKLKAAAALNIMLGGVPSIYYGQELGMKGEPLKGLTDGNEIPVREAYEWYAAEDGKGMALWYKNTGEWWEKRNMKPNDGISLEEEQKDPESLFNYYKKLLKLRKQHVPLYKGVYKATPNANPNVISFLRVDGNDTVLVMINLSGNEEFAMLTDNTLPLKNYKRFFGDYDFPRGGRGITLPPYGMQVWRYLPQ